MLLNVHKSLVYDRKTILNNMKIAYFMKYTKITYNNRNFKIIKKSKNIY